VSRTIISQARDKEVEQLFAARNTMESYILEMRSAKRQKHGQLIDEAALTTLLDEAETFLWDNAEASLADLAAKQATLQEQVGAVCAAYFQAQAKEKLEFEQALDAEASRDAARK
jgi:hypothetical protein